MREEKKEKEKKRKRKEDWGTDRQTDTESKGEGVLAASAFHSATRHGYLIRVLIWRWFYLNCDLFINHTTPPQHSVIFRSFIMSIGSICSRTKALHRCDSVCPVHGAYSSWSLADPGPMGRLTINGRVTLKPISDLLSAGHNRTISKCIMFGCPPACWYREEQSTGTTLIELWECIFFISINLKTSIAPSY